MSTGELKLWRKVNVGVRDGWPNHQEFETDLGDGGTFLGVAWPKHLMGHITMTIISHLWSS